MLTPEQKELRRQGLGGSDLAAVLGLSPWRSPMDVWLDKTRRKEDDETSEPMLWGSLLEDVVAGEYARRNGVKVRRVNTMLRVQGRPFTGFIDRAVHPDGKMPVVQGEFRTDRILECKTANAFAGKDWGASGTTEIPDHYTIQCLHYLGLTGVRFCDVAVLIGGSDYRQYTVEADANVLGLMWERGERWWRDYVAADKAPEPRTEGEAVALWPTSAGKSVSAPAEIEAAVGKLAALKDWIKQAEEREKALRDAICAVLGEADTLVDSGGRALVTWKSTKSTAVTDWEGLAQALNPSDEAVQQFSRMKPGYRRFALKTGNGNGNGNGKEG